MTRQQLRIAFCEQREIQEYESNAAIEEDVQLKQGSRIVAEKREIRPKSIITKMTNKLRGRKNKPTNVIPVSAMPLKSIQRSRGITVDPDLEIPNENIKTLLTLGFMSALATGVKEYDSDSLTSSDMDELTEIERRKEKFENMRTEPNPVKRSSFSSRIPVLSKTNCSINKQKRQTHDVIPVIDPVTTSISKRVMKNLPITTKITKWKIDGRLLQKKDRPYVSKSHVESTNSSKPWRKNMRVANTAASRSVEHVNRYGSNLNFVENDQLGPWSLNSYSGSQEGCCGLPPTPKVSRKNNKI